MIWPLDPHIKANIRRLTDKIYQFISENNADYREICKYLTSTVAELSMRYTPKKIISYKVGDVVDCNYCMHLDSEISGGHIHAIVCHMDENHLVYLVPILKEHRYYEEGRFLPLINHVDVEYLSNTFDGGTVSVKMGKYLDAQRMREVVGHVSPDYLPLLFREITKATSFESQEEFSWPEDLESPIDDFS